MSSLRSLSRSGAEVERSTADGWVNVTSPVRKQRQPTAAGVVLALAAARERHAAGSVASVAVDVDSLGAFGSGDADLASDVERIVDATWDE